MQDEQRIGPSEDSEAARALDALGHHPLLANLPEPARRCLETGRLVRVAMGESLAEAPLVRFVVSGAIGIFPAPGSACVGLVGPGGLYGLDRCFSSPMNETLVVLLAADVIEVSADRFAESTGRAWTERMFGHQATGRLRALSAEAACGLQHTAGRRLARWLVKLADASASHRRVAMTQSTLASVLGVQRTTVNAELCILQTRGVVATRRGSVSILCRDALLEAACACDCRSTVAVPARSTPVSHTMKRWEPARHGAASDLRHSEPMRTSLG